MDDLEALLHSARTHAESSPALQQILAVVDASRYLREQYFASWCRRARRELPRNPLVWLRIIFRVGEFPARTVFRIVWRRHRFREALNQRTVASILEREAAYFDQVEKQPLTLAQREACAVDEAANLVIAGAGTGKTSTIVAKIGLLVRSGICRPEEILAISFTRKSADELAERIESRLNLKISVSTFHKLGSDIIGRVTGKKPSLVAFADSKVEKTKAISRLIEQLSNDHEFKRKLVEFLAYYRVKSRQIWDFRTESEYREWVRANRIMSLDGVAKKSLEEVIIANWLIMMGVKFQYEKPYEFDTATPDHRQYQPDFYLPEHKIYIEHFGINARGETAPHINSDDYKAGIEWKRQTHATHGTRLIETYSWQHSKGTLLTTLQASLEQAGCRFAPQTLDTILASLNKAGAIEPFADLVSQFLTLFKGNGNRLTFPQSYESSEDRNRVAKFVALFASIKEAYESANRTQQVIDFEDMITFASEAVRSGRYASPYRYILIDEFQDISPGRSELVKALQEAVPDCAVYAVGDDWQSIYRFAGSDIGAMTQFSAQFGPTRRVFLDQTFRFDNRIAEVSRKFILRNPVQIEKTLKPIRHSPTPSVVLYLRPGDEAPLEWSLGQINQLAQEGASVLILERYRHHLPSPSDLREWRRCFPRLRCTAMSIHASKGLEADFVVVGLRGGFWGFPSQLVDDALLELVLTQADEYPHGEERRLLYVAVTRARFRSFLIADTAEDLSVFTQELMRDYAGEVEIAGSPWFSPCPRCPGGILKFQGSSRRLLTCTNQPGCSHSVPVCPKCRRGVLEHGVTQQWHCATCGEIHPPCPRCVSGILQRRQGPYGEFLGCSNYSDTQVQCRYKQRPI